MAENAMHAVSQSESILRGKENGAESVVASTASKKRVPKQWEGSLPFNGSGDKTIMEILNG